MKTTKTKIILVILLFAVAGEAYSHPVDMETARRLAQNFMGRMRSTSKTVSDVVTEQLEGHDSFYVVNFREGGWVMVSADDATIPVLAYSYDATYRLEDEKPGGFLFLIDGYKEEVDMSRKTGATGSREVIEMMDAVLLIIMK